MSSSDLADNLKDIIVKRKQGEGEFCYVYLPSGETVTGKKAALRLIQADNELYESLKESCKLKNESDALFDARLQKLIVSSPFEKEGQGASVTPKKTPAKPAAKKPSGQQTPAKAILKDAGPKKELLTKTHLSKLIARRRLEGGEFSYVYVPLEKVINGKKAMHQFLKNQHEEFTKLKNACKLDNETEEAFDTRIMKEMLTVPYEKEIIESAMDTDNGVELPTPKRKSNLDNWADENKKAKVEGAGIKYVYFETETLITGKVKTAHTLKNKLHLTQIGAINDGAKKFFKCIVDNTVNTASDTVLEKLNIAKKGRFQFVYKRFKREIDTCKEVPALEEFIKYLEETKKGAAKLCLVTYRKDNFQALLAVVARHHQRGRFTKAVDNGVVLENVFEQKPLKQYIPLKALGDLYKQTVGLNFTIKTPSSDDLAELLMKSCNILTKKHNFALFDFSIETAPVQGWKELQHLGENIKIEMEHNYFSVINSISFVKKEKFEDIEDSASTSTVAYRPPKASKTPAKKSDAEPEIIEMDIDEDNFEFTTVGQEILYQVLCQPILVKLGTMDENTKFIKFGLSKQLQKRANTNKFEILKDSSRVFWKNDTPYAFCNLCPEIANDVKYKPVKAKIVDTLSANTCLGEYKALNRTDEEQRNLSTKVLVDFVVTRAGDDNTMVRNLIDLLMLTE